MYYYNKFWFSSLRTFDQYSRFKISNFSIIPNIETSGINDRDILNKTKFIILWTASTVLAFISLNFLSSKSCVLTLEEILFTLCNDKYLYFEFESNTD